MIIDLILDRYHGDAYDPKEFYDAVMDYEEGTEYPISRALDGGEEEDVKCELCAYIGDEYNPNIKKFINAVEWLKGDDGKDYSKEIDIMAESKNESDFGAFDWTVTVSYIDKNTGNKASDVYLIKAHNMPSAKEQAILRANRKGTDAKVDSCRMGDYVSNESKTSEANSRKLVKQESKTKKQESFVYMGTDFNPEFILARTFDEILGHTNDDIVIEDAEVAEALGKYAISDILAGSVSDTVDEFVDEVETLLSGSPLDGSPFGASEASDFARKLWNNSTKD